MPDKKPPVAAREAAYSAGLYQPTPAAPDSLREQPAPSKYDWLLKDPIHTAKHHLEHDTGLSPDEYKVLWGAVLDETARRLPPEQALQREEVTQVLYELGRHFGGPRIHLWRAAEKLGIDRSKIDSHL